MKDKISGIITALQNLLKQKKILIMLTIGVVLLLAVLLFLLLGNKDDPSPDDSEQESSTSSSISEAESVPASDSESSLPEAPKEVTITGTNINSAGLCIVIPTSAEIKDPNIPASKANKYQPITAFSSGSHSEVALHFSDNVITKDSMTILCLQAFELGEASPELATYAVEADVKSVQSYSYAEIADKILYNADGKVVLDVTFAKKKAPRTTLEEYIEKSKGKELGHTTSSPLTPQSLLADGSYIYKYDWMVPAFDYVSEHIQEMIVPIHYATPYSLEELGYTFELGSAPTEPPYLASVSAATVKSTVEGGHSGAYTTVVYGGERLLGNYTVLQPSYVAGSDTPSNPSSFSLLQAFKRSDLELQETSIKFLRRDKARTSEEDYYKTYSDGSFSEFSLAPELLENYIIYKDDSVVVYDFFEFCKAPALENQLKRLSETEGYEQYGIETDGVAEARRRLVEAEGGLGRYIYKK